MRHGYGEESRRISKRTRQSMKKNIVDASKVLVTTMIDIIQASVEAIKEVEKSIKELVQLLVVVIGVLVLGLGGVAGYIFHIQFKPLVLDPCKTQFFMFLALLQISGPCRTQWLLNPDLFSFFKGFWVPFKPIFILV